jgi:hypothetical protein
MSEHLRQALRISGASLVMLTSIEDRTPVWSAGRVRSDSDVAALGAVIAEAAAALVRLTTAGVDLDDLLVTSAANFHVLRVVDGTVAHLVLDREVANLAMARREFRDVVVGKAATPERALPAPVAPEPIPVGEPEPVPAPVSLARGPVRLEPERGPVRLEPEPGPVRLEPEPGPVDAAAIGGDEGDPPTGSEALEGEVLPPSRTALAPTEPATARLPHRRSQGDWRDEPTAYQATVPALPAWVRSAVEGPFVNDAQTLARVVGGLKRLR